MSRAPSRNMRTEVAQSVVRVLDDCDQKAPSLCLRVQYLRGLIYTLMRDAGYPPEIARLVLKDASQRVADGNAHHPG